MFSSRPWQTAGICIRTYIIVCIYIYIHTSSEGDCRTETVLTRNCVRATGLWILVFRSFSVVLKLILEAAPFHWTSFWETFVSSPLHTNFGLWSYERFELCCLQTMENRRLNTENWEVKWLKRTSKWLLTVIGFLLPVQGLLVSSICLRKCVEVVCLKIRVSSNVMEMIHHSRKPADFKGPMVSNGTHPFDPSSYVMILYIIMIWFYIL